MIRLVTIVGARPQFIKAAPLSAAISAAGGILETVIHTGQHFDENMSAVFFEELGLKPPAFQLDVHGGPHGAMTARMLTRIEEILLAEKPDAVLVYGDTNSTLAAALAAAKLCVPIVHVEAGLRSFNSRMPEEINRVVTDHLSTVLLCPTSLAVKNLAAEGISHGVHHVGDIMYDIAVNALPVAERRSAIIERLGLVPGRYAVATVHRAENTDGKAALEKILRFLEAEAKSQPIVWAVHPRTREMARTFQLNLDIPGIKLTEPLGFVDMCRLLHHAAAIYTDSGGMQKEAYFHRVPCVTLRGETEWVETIEHGWNRLWSEPDYLPRRGITEYGNGRAAEEIVNIVKETFGR